jgi:hypothetical protein
MNADQASLRPLLIVIVVMLVGSLALIVKGEGLPNPGEPLLSAFDPPEGASHVVNLVARYGAPGLTRPLQGTMVTSTPQGPVEFTLDELGDVVLVNVEELPVADPVCAPTFVVTLSNSSFRVLRDLDVSIVAILGPLTPDDPTTTVRLAEIPAGTTVEVNVTLPVEALAMGRNGAMAVGFQKLLVAVDSRDRFAEVDEVNNLRLLARVNVPQRIVTEATTGTAPTPPPAVLQPAPAADQPLDAAIEEFRRVNPDLPAHSAQRI